MSLVAYDSSSESENETKHKIKKIVIPFLREFDTDDDSDDINRSPQGSSLLSLLPLPKAKQLKPLESTRRHLIPNVLVRKSKQKMATSKKICIKRHTPLEHVDLNIAPDVEKPYEGLNNDSFRQLINSKQTVQEIPTNLALIKAATEPTVAAEDQFPINSTCKKKHHITYLAQQARANEERLKEEWSQCKYKRQMTRLKYGF